MNEWSHEKEKKGREAASQIILIVPPRNLCQRLPIILLVLLRHAPLRRTGHHRPYQRRTFLVLVLLRDIKPLGFEWSVGIVLEDESKVSIED